ncbi:MAG: helix-turn-helix domain-containing protein [Oligoflexales bacterium]
MSSKDLFLNSVGEVIHQIRKEKKLTQEQLAVNSGISSMTIKRLEAAKASIQIDKLNAIAKCLGVNVAEIFRRAEGVKLDTPTLPENSEINVILQEVEQLSMVERQWFMKLMKDALNNPWSRRAVQEN